MVDTKKEHIAVDEARKLGIPVIAVLDTNCDPDEVDFPIPGNDDAIRSAELLTKVIATAVADGLIARSGRKAARGADEKPEPGAVAADEPLPEWERELLEGAEKKAEEPAPRSAAAEPVGRRPPGPARDPSDSRRPLKRESWPTSPPRTSRSSATSPAPA